MTYEYPLSWPPGFPRTKYPCPVTLRCAGACEMQSRVSARSHGRPERSGDERM
jgi:hypothetical protein